MKRQLQQVAVAMKRLLRKHEAKRLRAPQACFIQKSPICLVDKSGFFVGAPGGIRTLDLPVRSRALYPLSYKRKRSAACLNIELLYFMYIKCDAAFAAHTRI